MATNKEYRDFILDELSFLDDIICKPMMGEYLLYYKGVLFGGIYDNRLLVKIVDGNSKYGLIEEIPYNGAKPMYLIDEIDNKELIKEIIINTYEDLKKKNNDLLLNMKKIHTTKMGSERIKKNLNISTDAVSFCKKMIKNNKSKIYKKGKNWYCEIDNIIITINSSSYTIITAHKMDNKKG